MNGRQIERAVFIWTSCNPGHSFDLLRFESAVITLDVIRKTLLIGAPPGVRPAGAPSQNGFNPMDFALLSLE